jgi:hypothetical protein
MQRFFVDKLSVDKICQQDFTQRFFVDKLSVDKISEQLIYRVPQVTSW